MGEVQYLLAPTQFYVLFAIVVAMVAAIVANTDDAAAASRVEAVVGFVLGAVALGAAMQVVIFVMNRVDDLGASLSGQDATLVLAHVYGHCWLVGVGVPFAWWGVSKIALDGVLDEP